jgi:hypothetical protein
MTGEAKTIIGLVTLGVVVVIGDARVHYKRSLEKLQDAADGESPPPPAVGGPVLDVVHVLSDVDDGLSIIGTPPEFFATMMGG